MPFHLESNSVPHYKEYTEGGAAYVNGAPRITPFENKESPEAAAWFRGYDEAKLSQEKRLGGKLMED